MFNVPVSFYICPCHVSAERLYSVYVAYCCLQMGTHKVVVMTQEVIYTKYFGVKVAPLVESHKNIAPRQLSRVTQCRKCVMKG